MHEAEVALGWDALRGLGFEAVDEATVEVLDVRLLWCAGDRSLSVTTFSEAVDDLLAEVEAVERYERLDSNGDSPTYLCETVAPDLAEGATPIGTESTVLDVSPDENGGFILRLIGTREAFSKELDGSAPERSPVRLQRLGEYDGPSVITDRLTRRQREVVETAYDLGYYEVPREVTAAAVAERLNLDRSTVTEHLQRAERRLVAAALF